LNSIGTKKPKTSEALAKFHAKHPGYFKNIPNQGRFKPGHKGYDSRPWKGEKFREDTKSKMSASHILFNFEHPEVVAAIGAIHKGPNHWNWKGGISDPEKAIRRTDEYNLWRKSVYEKDDWACRKCGSKSDLVAHHIKSFASYPELRFDVDNGITLCRRCHKRLHSGVGLSTRFKPNTVSEVAPVMASHHGGES
jgi:hypothetical protein